MRYFVLFTFLCFNSIVGSLRGQNLEIEQDYTLPEFGTISLCDLSKQEVEQLNTDSLSNYLKLYVGSEIPPDNETPHIIGAYLIKENRLLFKPRFTLLPNVNYTVSYFSFERAEWEFKEFRVTPFHGEQPRVTSVFPGTESIPQNTLRFYLYFDQPMGQSNPYEFIKLENDQGENIEDAFVEITSGLWNSERTRLTVFIHPGRVKRMVGPNLKQGPVFEKGKSYRLILSSEFASSYGITMSNDWVKTFSIDAPVYEKINIANWYVIPPEIGTTNPLVIQTTSHLDEAIAQRMIQVKSGNSILDGKVQFTESKRQLIFTPSKIWVSGNYDLIIPSTIEDVCGNTVHYIFDKKVGDSTSDMELNLLSFRL